VPRDPQKGLVHQQVQMVAQGTPFLHLVEQVQGHCLPQQGVLKMNWLKHNAWAQQIKASSNTAKPNWSCNHLLNRTRVWKSNFK
jgi:hypothetical protein